MRSPCPPAVTATGRLNTARFVLLCHNEHGLTIFPLTVLGLVLVFRLTVPLLRTDRLRTFPGSYVADYYHRPAPALTALLIVPQRLSLVLRTHCRRHLTGTACPRFEHHLGHWFTTVYLLPPPPGVSFCGTPFVCCAAGSTDLATLFRYYPRFGLQAFLRTHALRGPCATVLPSPLRLLCCGCRVTPCRSTCCFPAA